MSKKRSRRKFLCLDCGVDTGRINEFYFVHTNLWLKAVGSIKGMLCIGCLEKRLGRQLLASDFPDVSINSTRHGNKSLRLLSHLTAQARLTAKK